MMVFAECALVGAQNNITEVLYRLLPTPLSICPVIRIHSYVNHTICAWDPPEITDYWYQE